MSTEVSIFQNKGVTTSSGKRLTKLGQSLASSSMSRRIQTNTNGTFKKIVNGEQVGSAVRGDINVIIVNALPKVSRVFYREKFDPNKEATLPNCWSNLGDKPEPNVPEPQHENCANCPMNVAGSGDNGGRACRYQRRIAVLLEDDPSGEVYQFNVPAKSLFGKGSGNVHPFESYTRFLVAHGESPDTVVTNVAYDDDADSMELQFSAVRPVDDEEYARVQAAQAKPEADMYVKITVAQADGVTKAPPKAADKPEEKAAKPKVQRTEEPEDEDDTPPEPVKRAKKKDTAKVEEPADAEDIASILEEWGDD